MDHSLQSLLGSSESSEETLCELCENPCTGDVNNKAVFCEDCKEDIGIVMRNKSKVTFTSTKMNKLIEILYETHEKNPGEKTIVFFQCTSMIDLIEVHLKKNNLEFCRCKSNNNL
jgi:SNF2 family DNA or RNA helicase